MDRVLWILLILFISCSDPDRQLTITTNNPKALQQYQKGIAHKHILELDEAEQAFEKAIQLDSTFAMAYLELAFIKEDFNRRRGLVEKAMSFIDQVSEGERLYILGKNKFYGNGEGDSEFNYYKRLVELYPNDDLANYIFAYINVHHGQHQPDTAIHYYKKALKINPNVSEYYTRLTEAYLLDQDFENAEKTINDHIAFLPNHESPRLSYGELLLTNHKYEASIEAYKEVLKINPHEPWAIIGIATNLNFLDKFQQARTILRQLDTVPLSDYEYRHKWRAWTCSYLVEGKLDSAVVVLKKQMAETVSGKNDREILFHQYYPLLRMTRFYFENKEAEKGLESYAQLKAFASQHISREATLNNVLRLERYYTIYGKFLKGRVEEAKNELLQLDEMQPDEKLLLAKIYLKQEDFNKAISLLEQLDIENPYYQYWRAQAYKSNRQIEKFNGILDHIKSRIEIDDLDYALAAHYLKVSGDY